MVYLYDNYYRSSLIMGALVEEDVYKKNSEMGSFSFDELSTTLRLGLEVIE